MPCFTARITEPACPGTAFPTRLPARERCERSCLRHRDQQRPRASSTAQQRPRRARLLRNAVPGLISSGCVTPSAKPAPAAGTRGSRSSGLNMHEAGAVGEPPELRGGLSSPALARLCRGKHGNVGHVAAEMALPGGFVHPPLPSSEPRQGREQQHPQGCWILDPGGSGSSSNANSPSRGRHWAPQGGSWLPKTTRGSPGTP